MLDALPGSFLRAGLVNGPTGRAEVLALEPELRLRFRPDTGIHGKSGPEIHLLLALPRPQILRKVLFLAPQLGIHRILLSRAARVEKSYFHSPLLSAGEWRRQLLLGMEQAGSTRLPGLLIFERFRPLVEDRLAELLPDGCLRLLPQPGALQGPETLPRPLPETVCLAVGPEGGWVPFELQRLEAAGFRALALGERILRVETAVCALCAQLLLLARLDAGPKRTNEDCEEP